MDFIVAPVASPEISSEIAEFLAQRSIKYLISKDIQTLVDFMCKVQVKPAIPAKKATPQSKKTFPFKRPADDDLMDGDYGVPDQALDDPSGVSALDLLQEEEEESASESPNNKRTKLTPDDDIASASHSLERLVSMFAPADDSLDQGASTSAADQFTAEVKTEVDEDAPPIIHSAPSPTGIVASIQVGDPLNAMFKQEADEAFGGEIGEDDGDGSVKQEVEGGEDSMDANEFPRAAVPSTSAANGKLPKNLNFLFCAVCKKIFMEKSALKVHIRIHTEEKPFGCDVCGRRFRTAGDLKCHAVVHTSLYQQITKRSRYGS